MSLALTFLDSKLLKTSLVGPDGAVHYTTSTTSGLRGRKVTTITAASGAVGVIDWRQKLFTINGAQRAWKELKSNPGGILNSKREWNWGDRPYMFKFNRSEKELLATPTSGDVAGTVRFTTYQPHLFHGNEPAVLYFPHQLHDEIERMFLLMAVLKTEIQREDTNNAAAASAATVSC
ncbi:hypothetical protein GGX14DRAFT_625149, partial [Mycena pura]